MLAWTSTLLLLMVSVAACGGSTVAELSGPTPVRCDTSLSGVPAVVGASGAQLQVTVVTSRDCVWSTAGGASWVQLSPRTGQGESILTLIVAANSTTSSRVTTVTVNDQSVNIVQEASPPPLPDPAPGPPSPGPPSPGPPASNPPTVVGPIDLDGRISALSGSCPNLSFALGSREVVTTAQTRFSGGNCRDMRNGVDVAVAGDLDSDGTVRATRVTIDD